MSHRRTSSRYSVASAWEKDVITLADGTLITLADELSVVVQAHAPGDTIKVTYHVNTNPTPVTVKVVLGSGPAQ